MTALLWRLSAEIIGMIKLCGSYPAIGFSGVVQMVVVWFQVEAWKYTKILKAHHQNWYSMVSTTFSKSK